MDAPTTNGDAAAAAAAPPLTNGAGADAGAGSAEPAAFTIKDEPVENLRPLKVRVIGAGYSGICAAIRIPERLRNIDLVVYEKNEGIGGVWWLNRYPGLACDIPSHSYQYSFAPNPRWSSLYAPGREIRQYLQDVAEKFGATRFIKTSHRVERCVWNEQAKKWKIKVQNLATGETFDEDCDVLVTARGQLNEISWPDIPGLKTFQGKLVHSADWDESFDYSNKRIGIIGNGSSAIQILPRLQKLPGVTLTSFMRSPTWISSAFGDQAMAELGLDPQVPEFTQAKRDELAADPEAYLRFRKVFENGGNLIHDTTVLGSAMQQAGQAFFADAMRLKLASKPELLKTIIPSFAPGCRRLTPGKGYLEALCEDNVEVVTTRIAEITPGGVRLVAVGDGDGDNSGTQRDVDVDVLVCATGFRVSEAPPFEVSGRNGLTLAERWQPYMESYLSVMCDGFPNYLMMFGPNSAIGFGSLTMILETECDYLVKIIRKLQKDDYASIEPKAERVADFSKYIDAYFKTTVYTDNCQSWYRSDGGKGDRIVGLWPGSSLHTIEALRSPRWEDFNFESADPTGNGMRWLGNGWSVTEHTSDPSWYINPEEVNWPLEGRPEDAKQFAIRPWSH